MAAGGSPLAAAEGRVAIVADAPFGMPATTGAVSAGGTVFAADEGRVAAVADACFDEVAATEDGPGTTAGADASDGDVFDGVEAPFERVPGTECPATCVCTVAVEGSPLAAVAGTAPADMLPCMLCVEVAMLDEGSATGAGNTITGAASVAAVATAVAALEAGAAAEFPAAIADTTAGVCVLTTVDASAAGVTSTGATGTMTCDGLTATGIVAAEGAFFAGIASTVAAPANSFLDVTAVMCLGCPSAATGVTLAEGNTLAAVANDTLLSSTLFGGAAFTNGPDTAAGKDAGGGG